MNILSRYSPLWAPDSGSGSSSGSSNGSAAPSSSSSDAASSSPSTSTPPSTGGEGDSAAASDSESSQLDFSSIFGDGDSDEASPFEPPQAKAPPKPTEVKAPEAPKAPPTLDAASKLATPAPTELSSSPPAQSGGELNPYDPGALAYALMQNEGAAIQHVADTLFKLSNEEIEALETDTVSAIPKLLAKGMVKGQLNMLQQLSRLIPAMISKHGEVTKRHSENESKFYARWPEIRSDMHGPLVMKYASVYRQMHPDAPLDAMIEDLGPMVMMAAKISPSPTQPAARSTNGRKGPQPSPFIPAGAVAAGAVPQHAQEMSAIESMFLTDD